MSSLFNCNSISGDCSLIQYDLPPELIFVRIIKIPMHEVLQHGKEFSSLDWVPRFLNEKTSAVTFQRSLKQSVLYSVSDIV